MLSKSRDHELKKLVKIRVSAYWHAQYIAFVLMHMYELLLALVALFIVFINCLYLGIRYLCSGEL